MSAVLPLANERVQIFNAPFWMNFERYNTCQMFEGNSTPC
jgi:hypothetical protein